MKPVIVKDIKDVCPNFDLDAALVKENDNFFEHERELSKTEAAALKVRLVAFKIHDRKHKYFYHKEA